jgi:imidazolonepropionase-like amidohydrolase
MRSGGGVRIFGVAPRQPSVNPLPQVSVTMRIRCGRLAAVVACLAASVQIGDAQVTAIRAGRVVDPDRGTSAVDQVILVDSGRITAIGSGIPVPPGATIIDLSTSTVSPGLVDAHTHLCMQVIPQRDHGNYYYTTLNDPDALRAIEGVANAKAMLDAGFTTVRDIGNEGNYACVQVRRAIERGLIPGPTMLTAGRIIAPYGGQFQLQPDKPKLAEPEYAFADTRDEMIRAVRENAHYGATVIKIVVDDQRYIYSADDIRFIKEEAARAGLRLAAHAWTAPGAHNAAEAGVASIEHGVDMSDADLSLAKKNGVALVGTEFVVTMFDSVFHRKVVDRLQRAHKLGVTLVYGTDAIERVAGKTRGEVAITGIDPWVEARIPAPVTLQAMTTNAARLLGVDGKRGALKVGMAADLIATPDDPLTNIQTLKQVTFVMKDGVVVRRPPAPHAGL